MVTVRPATSADAPTAAGLLADAFRDDPSWSMTLPDPTTRPAKLEAYYRNRIRRQPHLTDIAVIDGTVVGALLWEPPRSQSRTAALASSFSRAVKRLASRFPRGRGIAHALAVESYRPLEPHWYLHDIAASPQARGKGVGSALLGYRLGIIDAAGTTLAALEATTPGSRRLYERFGFEAVGKAATRPDEASTIMVRRPA